MPVKDTRPLKDIDNVNMFNMLRAELSRLRVVNNTRDKDREMVDTEMTDETPDGAGEGAPETPSPTVTDTEVLVAKIQTLETALATAVAENVALKAVNYDLLMSVPAEPAAIAPDATDEIDNPITFDTMRED